MENVVARIGDVMPNAVEFEESILASCIICPQDIPEILDMISPDDFYRSRNMRIFKAISDLHNSGGPVDTTTLNEKTGEGVFLGELLSIPIAANNEYYCQQVKGTSVKRRIIEQANAITKRAFSRDQAGDVLEYAHDSITGIGFDSTAKALKISDGIQETFDKISELRKRGGGLIGIDTGFGRLNKITLGWQQGDFDIIAGRPSMGKSALMLKHALISASLDIPTYIFSLEMSAPQLQLRAVSNISEQPLYDIRAGRYSDMGGYDEVKKAIASIKEIPLFVDYTAGITVQQIRRRLRRWFRKYGRGPVYVDYLQLMGSSSRKYERKDLEIADISSGLKAIAKDLDTTVIALSQLNRSLENRPNADKKPQLSDLRESGALEQDADIVLFPYRPEVYVKNKFDERGNPTDEYKRVIGKAYLIISKHRNGQTGEILLRWIAETTSFTDQGVDYENY